jgi:hypothetical protein
MLVFPHFVVDTRVSKCCFSSTMKRDPMRLLAGILAIFGLYSCASYEMTPSSADYSRLAPAPSIAAESASKPVPQRDERPGLATGWGHEKSSPTYGRAFVRSSSKPAGVDVIYYNNPDGIKAMTRQAKRVEGMQTAAGGLVEWGVKGRLGFLPTYKENWGYGRRLVSGEKDSTYRVVVRNRSKSPLEIVASVDGLDVKDGKSASYSKRGYLVDPGETLEIDGFRTSYDRVAAFKFSSVSGSYANLRHGDTRNVGVIGIAVFTQKGVDPWAWMPDEVQTRDQAQPFAQAPR